MYKILKSLTLIAFASACQPTVQEQKMSVVEKLGRDKNNAELANYVAQFATAELALEHVAEVRKLGGEAQVLRNSTRIIKASINSERAKKLVVDADLTLVPDASVKVSFTPQSDGVEDAAELADSVMTAKGVVGVTSLQTRFPKADGRGVVVAVFDTGIDFGLRGVSDGEGDERKLVGYYDMTHFGRVRFTADQRVSDPNASVFDIGAKQVRVAESMGVRRVLAKGLLSEKDLAAAYLSPRVDLNNNGAQSDSPSEQNNYADTYVYLVGINSLGQPAVWVDVDGNGIISDVASEELTDFNQTGKHVPLRTDTSPIGAKPLAVSIFNEDEIQFHSVEGGHGTSCAIVIGGDGYANGYLQGMAPKVKFISYMLDVTGQDVYTMSQFMDMFLHARAQHVDAISISWGFTVSDLKSARYFSRFLDEEIASHGIVIGVANGNEGPAYSSGYATDYIPHHGFAVGAMISADQARNVYGWNGDVEDSVIWYSSFGPTRGGRQVPDVISPLMTMVRGERSAQGTIFRGFGGTSSATPALIGAVAAMLSKLKAEGLPVDPRLVKMAVQNTATPIQHVDENRQGRGVINIDKAYDLYVDLIGEFLRAKQDPKKSTRFPYELRASVQIAGRAEMGEGIVSDGSESSKQVFLNIAKTSRDLIDPLHFAEPLVIRHGEDFFKTNDTVLLQASGASFSVQFDQSKLYSPGTYTDSIELVRPTDGLVLASIPVVVRIAYQVPELAYQVDSVDTTLSMNDQWRSLVRLSEPTQLLFDGVAVDRDGGFGTYLGFFVQSDKGDIVFQDFITMKDSVKSLNVKTPSLPAGVYEIVIFRGGSRPAVVTDLRVAGAWRKPSAKVLATEINREEQRVRVLLDSRENTGAVKAKFVIKQRIHKLTLTKDLSRPRKGFYGELEAELSGVAGVRILQSEIDERSEEFLNVSLAINNLTTPGNMYRGWVNFWDRGAPTQSITLAGKAEKVEVLAYPNIVNWQDVKTRTLHVELHQNLVEPISSHLTTLAERYQGSNQAIVDFRFDRDDFPRDIVADLVLVGKDGEQLESIRVEVR